MLAVFLFFYFLYRTSLYPIPERAPLSLFFRIDGLLALFTSISTQRFSTYFLPAFIILLLVFARGNFFCFWICPFGGAVDFLNIVAFRKKWRLSVRVPSLLRKARFFFLGGFLLTALLAVFVEVPHFFWAFDPYVIMARAFVFRGVWMVFFALIMAASLVMPRVWCNNACPLGCLNNMLGVRARFFLKRKITEAKRTK